MKIKTKGDIPGLFPRAVGHQSALVTLSAPLLHQSALRTRGFAYYGPVFSYSVFLVVSLDPFDIFSVKETGNEKELSPCRSIPTRTLE